MRQGEVPHGDVELLLRKQKREAANPSRMARFSTQPIRKKQSREAFSFYKGNTKVRLLRMLENTPRALVRGF